MNEDGEGRKEGMKMEKEGVHDGEGRNADEEGRKEGRTEGRKEGRKEEQKEGMTMEKEGRR